VPPLTTVSETEVIFSGALALDVPSAYFYALTYDLSTNVTRDSRYRMVLGSDQQSNLDRLAKAVNEGWINLPVAMNPAQAVRILDVLNIPASTTAPQWPVTNPSANQIFKIDWVAYPPTAVWQAYRPGDDIAGFLGAGSCGASRTVSRPGAVRFDAGLYDWSQQPGG